MLEIIKDHIFNIIGSICVILLTSWLIWRSRERQSLRYIITESDFFPTDKGQGKYYAIKIVNDGKKVIKNINAIITVTNAEINIVTENSDIPNMQKEGNQIKFSLDRLHKNREVNFVITTKAASETSQLVPKIEGEDIAATEGKHPVKNSDWITAAIFSLIIGFIGGGYYVRHEVESPDSKFDKIQEVFTILNKAEISHVFPKTIQAGDQTYVATAFCITHAYLQDPANRAKYVSALKKISALNITGSSKGTIYYLIYKINTHGKNSVEATEYLDKCKNETPDIYEYLSAQDKYYNLDSLQKQLMKSY